MFNIVDWVILGTLVFFAVEAIRRPLILEILDFSSFLVAFFISFSYFNLPAKLFESQFKVTHGLSLVLGFMVTWFLSETVFYLIIRIVLPKIPKVKFLNYKFLSLIPATLRGLIFIALVLAMIATFPIQPTIKKTVLESKIGSQILKASTYLEQPVKSVFGGVTNDSLTFLTIKPKTDERVILGFQTTKFKEDVQAEIKMVEMVNKERADRGIKTLTLDTRLREIARNYSADMFTRGYFSHYSPEGKSVADRALAAGIDFLVIGENLAYAPDVNLAFKGLMNSEGHRENILSKDYAKIGIGAMDGGVYEEMFTQVFSN